VTGVPEAFSAIQRSIWECTACAGDARMEIRFRQQTRVIPVFARLRVVATAPPYRAGVERQIEAASVHSDPQDRLRAFLTKTLALDWEELVQRGLAVVHAVKCAVVPKDREEDERQHQDPPQSVTTKCAHLHFAREFRELRAPVVMTLGGRARLALRRACGTGVPPVLARALKEIPRSRLFEIDSNGLRFRLIASAHPFADLDRARADLLKVAAIAGIKRDTQPW
jgi:hypothetical protein